MRAIIGEHTNAWNEEAPENEALFHSGPEFLYFPFQEAGSTGWLEFLMFKQFHDIEDLKDWLLLSARRSIDVVCLLVCFLVYL